MLETIRERLESGKDVRWTFPAGSVLHFDRELPFLLVYRQPRAREDAGTERLIAGEAAHLIMRLEDEKDSLPLIRWIAERGSVEHGAFLLLELWSGADESSDFTIHAPSGAVGAETVDRLVDALTPLGDGYPSAGVRVVRGEVRHPPDLQPLLAQEESWRKEILVLGLEVPPLFRDSTTGEVYPRFLPVLQHALSRALRRGVYEFIRVHTTSEVQNHLSLGTRSLGEEVLRIDRELVEIERTFDLLLLVTPVNLEESWTRFVASDYSENPAFHYRLLPLDPSQVKRRLYSLEIKGIADPAIAELFQDKRDELDTQLTMLGERGSARFRYNSYRLYGTTEADLVARAERLLTEVPRPERWRGEWVDAMEFRDAAEREFEHYRRRYSGFDREIQIRRDLTGLMVSGGNLLIGQDLRIRSDRVTPLIHHEVGTHVLTYVNGSAQPLLQLSRGLADYDELQEGLAVLSEYLVGGLDRARMRLLGARVLAARSVEDGADFVETFRLLTTTFGYTPSGAWHVATRVHASGGFTRDMVYMRGLVKLLELLREGGDLHSLYIGKIAQKHLPVIAELRAREVLREPPLTPRFLENPAALERLERVRRGITLPEMISPS